jgi:hypothetical protein
MEAKKSVAPASSGKPEPVLSVTGFSAARMVDAGKMVIVLKGNADSHTADPLGEYLLARHEEAVRRSVRDVVLDCSDLAFLTSSCIKEVAVWIRAIMSMDPGTQYKVVFRIVANVRWQERTFEVLCRMAPELLRMSKG